MNGSYLNQYGFLYRVASFSEFNELGEVLDRVDVVMRGRTYGVGPIGIIRASDISSVILVPGK